MQIANLKLHLIEQIMKMEHTHSLKKVEETIKELHNDSDEKLAKLVKPMRKKLDIEELKKEQNYKHPSKELLNKIIKEADIQEPIEDLLKMI